MITKQEGGMDQGRLAVPGEKRDWVARNLIPSLPPRLFMPSLSQRSAPSLGFRGSSALGGDKHGLEEGGDLPLKGKIIYMSISVLRSDWSRSSLASFSKFAAKTQLMLEGLSALAVEVVSCFPNLT